MAKYRLSKTARQDLIRIHQFGVYRFGERQAENYLNQLFEYFEIIAERPLAFESVDHIRKGYRRCVCGSESIFYRIANSRVEIMTIVGQQDIDQILTNQ